MRKLMKAIPAQTHFLLLMRPGVCSVDFIAVADNNESSLTSIEAGLQAMNQAFNNKREEIAAHGPDYFSTLSNSKRILRLGYEIVIEAQGLVPEIKLTDHYIHAVAVNWLEQDSIPLGDAPKVDDQAIDPWRTTPANHAQLRFQDAIDWYATHNCSPNLNQFQEHGGRFEGCEGVGNGRNVVLKVPTPASRDRIVAPGNLKLFIAEHLLAYNKNAAAIHDQEENEDPGLTFFFLPLKGLGQVRSAIDWVGDTKGTSEQIHRILNDEATNLLRSGLESLFTQSLIGNFGVALRQALGEAPEDENQSPRALHYAFADLWWASEVRFYRNSQFQVGLIRAEARDETTWSSSSEERNPWQHECTRHEGAYSGFVGMAGEPHPGLSYISLNLAALFERGGPSDSIQRQLAAAGLSQKDLDKTYQSVPFDEVIFACHFFRSDPVDLTEWADQLAETVISALIDQTIQRTRIIRSKAKALEGVAHWLNSLVRMAGRSGAARNLENALRLMGPENASRVSVEQAYDSLQLLVLLEAGTGLLRLLGTLDEGDPAEKLGHWFTESSLAEWDLDAAFAKYQNSLTHLVRAIGSSFGHPSILVCAGGEEKLYADYCALDLDELLFPPLSKTGKGNEPILALLPALTEPIANALTYIKSKELLGSDTPLVLVIEDHRREELPSIKVEIGSPYFEGDHLPSSHGLAIARQVSALTGLAEIGEGEVKPINGRPYYFVPVLIHPQVLAQRLERTYDGSTKKTQTAHNR